MYIRQKTLLLLKADVPYSPGPVSDSCHCQYDLTLHAMSRRPHLDTDNPQNKTPSLAPSPYSAYPYGNAPRAFGSANVVDFRDGFMNSLNTGMVPSPTGTDMYAPMHMHPMMAQNQQMHPSPYMHSAETANTRNGFFMPKNNDMYHDMSGMHNMYGHMAQPMHNMPNGFYNPQFPSMTASVPSIPGVFSVPLDLEHVSNAYADHSMHGANMMSAYTNPAHGPITPSMNQELMYAQAIANMNAANMNAAQYMNHTPQMNFQQNPPRTGNNNNGSLSTNSNTSSSKSTSSKNMTSQAEIMRQNNRRINQSIQSCVQTRYR